MIFIIMPPRVVPIPGRAADASMWAAQRTALAAARDVHVSDVHSRFATPHDMAHALLAEHPGRLNAPLLGRLDRHRSMGR